MEPLNIFVTLFGMTMLSIYITFRILLRHAASQGIYLDYNKEWLQFIGWLGIVVLVIGIALIVADKRKGKEGVR